ncbi:hypothetical protein PHYSODRAFT_488504 [Phytophthora sojae]|uniref:Uncharacterized protein n=1 Tax=Phytophthora sojae (strain P6497) TaxID=1094619 RepID=G4Z1V4_PHYSP|nr:hypothetical protein PHYSODRAFT_488504 [Phytophthora sojae]EGZ19952.1 hypothetical protein PHYSODRAFT_488504 [Phytophthora sojae]|eukprot:XP_009522669.1 hypothetical protein PHYSODRAFT_488504 [Phytophthora sojae]
MTLNDIIQWLCTLGEEVAQIPTRDLINKETNSYGALPMGTAAWRGHLRVMQWLYENGAVVNARDRYNRTALHWASCRADLHVMEWLVSKGSFDVNGTGSEGRTALHEAAEVGRVHVVRWLLDRGAEIDKQDDEG